MADQPAKKDSALPERSPPTGEDDDFDVPDPDEDDLDDLDDMLGEFNSVQINPSQPSPVSPIPVATQTPARGPQPATGAPAAAATRGIQSAEGDEEMTEEEFSRQLQDGMANLLGELETSPEMQAQFEDIFRQIGVAAAAVDNEPPPSSSAPPTPPIGTTRPPSSVGSATGEASFQETIRRTMERMQASGAQATAASTADTTDGFLEEMMKQFASGNGFPGASGAAGDGSDDDFSKMLMGMMEQLTNKEILYEPMKELHDRFPPWLVEHRATLNEADRKRYEEQQRIVGEIVGKFEEPDFSDDNPAHREYIVERMQKMQEAGAPPPDLVGDIPSAQEALGAPDDEACNPQ